MALRDIAVFLDPSPGGDERLRLAASVAQAHKARLTGICVAGRPAWRHGYVRGHGAIRSLTENWFLSEQRCAVQGGRRFAEVVAPYRLHTNFRVIGGDAGTDERIVLNSLLADMVVIGQQAPHGLPEGWRPDHLLSACGVPLLVVPAGWRDRMVAAHVVVAWNASREARRAVADAMPLLAAARSVTVFVVDSGDDQPCIDVALHLARHGVRARIGQVASGGAPVAEMILSEASRHDADLVVMGARRHARLMGAISGGAAQAVIRRATVPVLMSQ